MKKVNLLIWGLILGLPVVSQGDVIMNRSFSVVIDQLGPAIMNYKTDAPAVVSLYQTNTGVVRTYLSQARHSFTIRAHNYESNFSVKLGHCDLQPEGIPKDPSRLSVTGLPISIRETQPLGTSVNTFDYSVSGVPFSLEYRSNPWSFTAFSVRLPAKGNRPAIIATFNIGGNGFLTLPKQGLGGPTPSPTSSGF